MPNVNISIPLRTAQTDGFFNHAHTSARQLFGYRLRLNGKSPYYYLELQDVPSDEASEMLEKVRAIVPWASLRLDFAVTTPASSLRKTSDALFDGQFPTSYPSNVYAQPMRMDANHRTEEADALLFSALIEGSQIPAFTTKPAPEVQLACELFAAIDFEVSANARLLALTGILEILAKPKPRRKECIDIVDAAIERAKKEADIATDSDLKEAMRDMLNSAKFWRDESIRGSIRRFTVEVSKVLGDSDPEAYGRRAVKLYDKRSKVTHSGASATLTEVKEARQIAREAIAVKANKHDHIRERFPTN